MVAAADCGLLRHHSARKMVTQTKLDVSDGCGTARAPCRCYKVRLPRKTGCSFG